MTVEVLALTTDEARRLTERIRVALDRIATSWADLAERIGEAYERRADLALGYDSWESYAAAELRPSEGIAAEVRRELVGLLSARGMSPRSIAPVIDVTRQRVSQIRIEIEGASDLHPAPERIAERIDLVTGEVVPAPTFHPTDVTDWDTQEVDDMLAADEREMEAWKSSTMPAPVKVTGLDGKSYSRPAPSPPQPQRRPLRDGFRDAALDLDKLVRRFESLATDDRLARNKNEIARYANDLTRAIDALQRVAEQIS